MDEARYPVRKDEKAERDYYVRMAWYFTLIRRSPRCRLFFPAPFLGILSFFIGIWVFLLIFTDFFVTSGIRLFLALRNSAADLIVRP